MCEHIVSLRTSQHFGVGGCAGGDADGTIFIATKLYDLRYHWLAVRSRFQLVQHVDHMFSLCLASGNHV